MTTNNSIVFSGHRNVNVSHVPLIEDAVESACRRADNVFVGGAAGFDTLALLWISHVIRFDPGRLSRIPHVWIVVPARLEDQPPVAQFAVEWMTAVCPDKLTVVEMGRSYNGESLKARNREMIDRAISLGNPELVCYFDGTFRSGTYSAMCYAKRQNVPVTQILS